MRAARWPMVSGLVLAMALWTGSPAAASQSVLCTGYVPCSAAGMSDAGYGAVSSVAYWGMTPGHNCTNYVAFRLTHGRLVARPINTGMAGTWGTAAIAAGVPVDDVPTVGSVAWWAPNRAPAGEKGHVAYVEAVRPDGSFLISEDNLGGDFHWEQFSRTGTGWPSGFIHYPNSDGSPSGTFTSVSSPQAGQLDFWGTGGDPDALNAPMTYLVTLGGPRTDPTAEQFSFTTPYASFHQIRYPSTRGPTTMYLYAVNLAGTGGHDTLLGARSVTIRSTSTTSAAFSDATITKATTPKIVIAVRPGSPTGTVTVLRGTTVVTTYAMAAAVNGKVTVSLPRQSKGTLHFTVQYGGSSFYMASATGSLTLAVR